ncbi:hypothetical protein ES703_49050 [subsurface metagenome]
MGTKLPDPKTLVDSIADGVVEVAEGPARMAKNVAGVAETFASEMKANMDDVKSRLPDDPSVLADAAIKAVGQTAKAGLGVVEGVGNGIQDTFRAVKSQIERVL